MKLEHGVADILTPEISANENINKPAFARPEFLSMYEISGQDEITEHSLVRYLSDKKQDQKIKEAAGNSPLLLEKKIIDSLKDERGRLIRAGLAQANLEIKIVCAQMIYCAFENERGKLIRMGLEQEDQETKRVCARMIMYASASERVELIRMGLEQEDLETRSICSKMIRYAFESDRKALLELAKKNLGDSIVEPRLYEKINVLKDKFSRKQFPKDGSETFLVGGQLKGKTIIRRIIPSAFMAWQKMYEDCGLWKNEGFDYVPVEPIISYHLNKQDLVDVYSGVLDLSLADWEILDGEFLGELNRDADKIKSVLRKQGVVHGHDCHSGNFCLRFFRD